MPYNTRISLRRPAAGEDAAGQPAAGWINVRDVWSDPLQLNGLEAIRAEAKTSELKASFRLRWCTDVVAGWSVLQGVTVYEVKAVLPDLRRRLHVDLVCELLP